MFRKGKKAAAVLAAVLALAVVPASGKNEVFSSKAGLGWTPGDDMMLSSNRFTQPETAAGAAGKSLSLSGYEKVAQNANLALYLRQESASIRVVDLKSGYVWGGLAQDKPDDLNRAWSSFGNSIVSIEYFNESGNLKQIGAGNRDNTCTFDVQGNTVVCNVSFDELDISLTAKVTLLDDRIQFSLDDSSIKETGEYYLANVYFAPFLGSTVGNEVNGYMFVPDGSGALIRFDKPSNYLEGFSRRVYGSDLAIDNLFSVNDLKANRPNDFMTDEETVTMPVYGIVHGAGSHALFAHIDSGAEYASIVANPSGMTTDYNWVSAAFTYKQMYQQPTSASGAGIQVVQKKRNTVNPKLSVYFLNGLDADYGGMARLYRSLLEKEGALSGRSGNASTLALDFVMADIKKGFLFSSTQKTTSLSDVESAAERLTKDGVRGAQISLLGWEKGGLNGYKKSKAYNSTVDGSFGKITALKSSLAKLGFGLSMYIDPLRAKDPQVNTRQDVGITLSQSTIEITRDDTDVYLGDTWFVKIPKALKTLQKQAAVLASAGLGEPTLDGLGNLLYGEYLRSNFVSRTAVRQQVEKTCAALSGKDGLTLFEPNDYLLADTAVYRSAPMTGSQYLYETDSVPFVQMVLSGSMTMFAPYANESFYTQSDVLKCIEYDVYPSFILTGKDSGVLKNTGLSELNSTCFNDWESTIVSTYKQVDSALTHVRGQQMVGHSMLKTGVAKCVYSGGDTIYVNYTSEPYTTKDGVIPSQSALYVKR